MNATHITRVVDEASRVSLFSCINDKIIINSKHVTSYAFCVIFLFAFVRKA